MNTLFGHLVGRFGSSQAENLATEGLHYVLSRSAEARRVFIRLLERSGVRVAGDLLFGTQAADENGAIPDLVGRDASGSEVAIVESKFWAGLTARQPNTYLARLQNDGLLLFIAPAQRFESLWPELLHRCRTSGQLPTDLAAEPEWRAARLDGGRRLALTSWRTVLESLHAGLTQAGEVVVAADVLQLRGLADRMDSDAFLPLTSEELAPAVGRRIVKLCELVDHAVDRLRAAGLADTSGCRASGGRHGTYNRFFRLHQSGARLYFDPPGWAQSGVPITLWVGDNNWRPCRAVNEALSPLSRETPSPLVVHPEWGAFVRVRLPFGAESDAVLDLILAQVRGIAELVRAVQFHGNATNLPSPPDDASPTGIP